jgi:hypothetical protein
MNRLSDRLPSPRLMPAVFLVAVALNYLWELAQGPLYEGVTDDPSEWWHCFVASLGDGILVCLIDALGCLVFQRRDWFYSGHRMRIPFLILAGIVVGVAVEWIGARVLRRWAYEPSMPLVPGLELGLVPVIQMTVLPAVVFLIVAAALKPGSGRRT